LLFTERAIYRLPSDERDMRLPTLSLQLYWEGICDTECIICDFHQHSRHTFLCALNRKSGICYTEDFELRRQILNLHLSMSSQTMFGYMKLTNFYSSFYTLNFGTNR
jgi:hypothetical protein